MRIKWPKQFRFSLNYSIRDNIFDELLSAGR
jgi:hypothetical protein